MSTRKTLLLGSLVILIAAVAGAASVFPANSISVEEKALTDLGVKFTAPGNAAEIIHKLSATPRACFAEGPIEPPDKVITPSTDAEREKQQQMIAKAGSCLESLLQASRMQDYALWGTVIKPGPKDTVDVLAPDYALIFRLCVLLMAQGRNEAAGNARAAEDKLFAVINIGRHLQQDPDYISYVVGVALKRRASQELSELYKSSNPDLAAKWAGYSERQQAARDELKPSAFEPEKWSEEKTTAFIRDPDMPMAAKVELITLFYNCGMDVKCRFFGPPGWVKKLRNEIRDPQAQIVLKLNDNEFAEGRRRF